MRRQRRRKVCVCRTPCPVRPRKRRRFRWLAIFFCSSCKCNLSHFLPAGVVICPSPVEKFMVKKNKDSLHLQYYYVRYIVSKSIFFSQARARDGGYFPISQSLNLSVHPWMLLTWELIVNILPSVRKKIDLETVISLSPQELSRSAGY